MYDANGNVTDDGARTFTWDAENRIVTVTYKAQPSRSTAFRYDGLGRRSSIIVNNGAISTETRYLWCGSMMCQARNTVGVVQRRYYQEGEVIPGSGSLLLYGRDHLASVRDVIAAPTGSRVASFDYDPYGTPTLSNGRISTDVRYAGMFYEQSSGLYLTRYRAYDPKAAQWLSRDPSSEFGSDGPNLYPYVRNNPINYVDRQGGNAATATWGAELGAEAGTFIAPGVGTVIGGVIGAVAGAAAGWWLGDKLGDILFNKPPNDAHDPNGAKAPGKPEQGKDFRTRPVGNNGYPTQTLKAQVPKMGGLMTRGMCGVLLGKRQDVRMGDLIGMSKNRGAVMTMFIREVKFVQENELGRGA